MYVATVHGENTHISLDLAVIFILKQQHVFSFSHLCIVFKVVGYGGESINLFVHGFCSGYTNVTHVTLVLLQKIWRCLNG